MAEWHFSYDGQQTGPFNDSEAQAKARSNPNGHVWRDGYSEWLPISQVAELTGSGSAPVSPPPPISGRAAHEINFQIFGEEMQFVEIELDPGESAVAEAGTMMYKDTSIQMHTIFGDGSAQADQGGFMDKLLGAGKRLLTGESLFITVFTHEGSGKAKVAFGGPLPGQHHSHRSDNHRRETDLPKRQLSVGCPRSPDRYSLPEENSDRPLRRGRFHHAEAGRRRDGLRTCRRVRRGTPTGGGSDTPCRHRLRGCFRKPDQLRYPTSGRHQSCLVRR